MIRHLKSIVKGLYLILSLTVFGIVLSTTKPTAVREVKLLKANVDERGYISVVYTQATDTLALDYLTHSQLDSLISK